MTVQISGPPNTATLSLEEPGRERRMLRQALLAYEVVEAIDEQVCGLRHIATQGERMVASDERGHVPMSEIRSVLRQQEDYLLQALSRCQVLMIRLGANDGTEPVAPDAALEAAGVGREQGRKGAVGNVLAALRAEMGEGDE